jgi:DNA-directed RNA polymerase specialized sigma24 family protein
MVSTSASNDAELLARYSRDGDDSAFAALVRNHQAMVVGAAWRRTGDVELARDVAQQVFATLAQKAWMLADRKSLAGWLHVAATHLAIRAQQSEAARRRRQEQAAAAERVGGGGQPWPLLEEALISLGDGEREAVVLHYLEDQSYPEIAAALGISEAAARKRVSRGLETLGAQLRRRGFGGSATALLTGAVAVQFALPSAAVAGTTAAAVPVPLALTLTTFMAHTAIKIAVAVAVVAALPIAWQSHANSELRAELGALQQQARPAAPEPIAARDNAPLRAEAAALDSQLADARSAEERARKSMDDTRQKVERLQTEVVVSYGKPEDIARSLKTTLDDMVETSVILEAMMNEKRELTPAEQAKVNKLMTTALSTMATMKNVMKMEDQPQDAAKLYSTFLGDGLGLSEATRKTLESTVAADFETLKRDGLTNSQRPKVDPESWEKRRNERSAELKTRWQAVLAPEAEKHALYSQIFEIFGGQGVLSSDMGFGDTFANPAKPGTNP